MGVIRFFDPIQKKYMQYSIDNYLLRKWNKIRHGKLVKKDNDRVYIVDGNERIGKSVFAMQQAKYLDPNFSINNVCFTPDEFLNKIKNAAKGSVIIFDEAFRGLSSKGSQSKVNKKIVQAMMEMGQRNLIVFIVLPTIFLLEIYPAVFRSEALFHIYKNKTKRRCFRVYNRAKKQELYMIGKKKYFSYSKPMCRIRGNFKEYYTIDEEVYRKKKLESLRSVEDLPENAKEEYIPYKKKSEENYAKFCTSVHILHDLAKFTYKKIAELYNEQGMTISVRGIEEVHKRYFMAINAKAKVITQTQAPIINQYTT